MFYYELQGDDVSVFVANKLAYFLQRLGETSLNRLKFEASHYGPYSVQVAHLLHNVNGKYLKGLEQLNAKAFEPLELQYDRMQEISQYVKTELTPAQRARISNLIELMDGFQSTLSLEILATVDYVKKTNPGKQEADIVNLVQNWSDRKRSLFKGEYIKTAYRRLQEYGSRLSFS